VTAQLRTMDFPYEYRAEVVGDAVSRADTQNWILTTVLGVAVLAYLLLQSALATWRGAALLMIIAPFGAVGALIGAQLTGGVLTGGVLAAVFTVVALALRQALVLLRRAQESYGEGVTVAAAMRDAIRHQAPVVTGVALATAALFLPAAVMGGGAGLELLHPFAVSLLAGLISETVVVLLVVPGLYPAVAGLRRTPGELDGAAVPEPRSDEEPVPQARPAVPAVRSDNEKENEGVL
jgi:multidrug efflux pump subunit AcrB